MARTSADAIRAALADADFPAAKGELVTEAESHGADEPTVKALWALPLAEYGNVDEVVASVDAGG